MNGDAQWTCPRCCVSHLVRAPSGRPKARCEQDGCDVLFRTGIAARNEAGEDLVRMIVEDIPAPPPPPPPLAEAVQHRAWFARHGRAQ